MGPGSGVKEKGYNDRPNEGYNNIGTQGNTPDPDCTWCEGGSVSRVANQIPGINAVSGMHDMFQISMTNEVFRTTLNVPGMFVAAGMTYGGYVGSIMNRAPDYIYTPITNDLGRRR